MPIRARMPIRALIAALAVLLLGAGAHGAEGGSSSAGFHRHGAGASTNANMVEQVKTVVATYARQRHAQYAAILASVEALQTSCAALIADPTDTHLVEARAAWIDAHRVYSPSECHRYYAGPIDEPRADLENRINAWPIDESWIDYVAGDPDGGIINQTDLYPAITRDLLVKLNRKDGEKNIATGYHAVEFLLWGQGDKVRGPGIRTANDYAKSAKNAERRATYLTLVLDQLHADLAQVAAQWQPDVTGDYADGFTHGDLNLSLHHILVGMSTITGDEIACERMAVAYESRSQEDGQSCFSCTTLDDLMGNIQGVRDTYLGHAPVGTDPSSPLAQNGPGPSDLVRLVDPLTDQRCRECLDQCVALIAKIPKPFAAALQGDDAGPSRTAIREAIAKLQVQRLLIISGGRSLGITVEMGNDPDLALRQIFPEAPEKE